MDFNDYRARYSVLTTDEHREAYQTWHAKYPEQRHCTLPALAHFLGNYSGALVVEMGGWDGWAAGEMLKRYPKLEAWLNVEFCEGAARSTTVSDDRYHVYVPSRFQWWHDEIKPSPDSVLVASHVIEHLSDADASSLIATARPRAWYIEAPLTEEGQDWEGYLGSHVLRAGWKQLEEWLHAAGYDRRSADGDARTYSRAR